MDEDRLLKDVGRLNLQTEDQLEILYSRDELHIKGTATTANPQILTSPYHDVFGAVGAPEETKSPLRVSKQLDKTMDGGGNCVGAIKQDMLIAAPVEIPHTSDESKKSTKTIDNQLHSLRLYKALEEVGASETLRKLHQRTAIVHECLHGLYFGDLPRGKDQLHICGSRYEGSVTPDLASDVDHIVCLFSMPVVLDTVTYPRGLFFLLVRDPWTYPGYAKLQLMYNGVPFTKRENVRPDGTRLDIEGKLCRTHEPSDEMQGPASMAFNEKGEHIADTVFAYKCDSIPNDAYEWLYRYRTHNWPSAEQLDIMSKMGCMFVRIGHWQSSECDMEWRMSFSLQERFLMESLNPTQHKVYILLKLIKKSILGRFISGESLSSYQCKTCIFYAVEQTPTDFWRPDNLNTCTVYCLKLLLQWTKQSICPNYFVKDQNLFSKKSFLSVRDNLERGLELLIKSGDCLGFLIDSDSISRMLKGEDKSLTRSIMVARKCKYILELKLKVIRATIETYISVMHDNTDPLLLFGMLQSSPSKITNHSQTQSKTTVIYICPWLHLHAYKVLVASVIDMEICKNTKMLLEVADAHFRRAIKTDVSSARFAKAAILYKYGKYEDCDKLLKEIEDELNNHVIVACLCLYRTVYHGKDENPDIIEHISQRPISAIVQNHIASCAVFSRSESRITPTALQFEMYRSLDTEPGSRHNEHDIWFDFAAVDARVYLYFMQYLVCSELHQDDQRHTCVDKIKMEIENCDKQTASTGMKLLGHKETAYNLLGWIYLQEQRYGDAKKCFVESLKIRTHHNAAKFHIRDMQE